MAKRPRRRPASAPPRGGLWLLAVVLFAGGIWLGVELAAPPPAPDFARLGSTAADSGASASPNASAGSTGVGARDGAMAREAWDEATAPGRLLPTPADPVGANEPSTTSPAAAQAAPQPAPPILRQPPSGGGARVAIVIDDLGRSLDQVRDLAALGVPLTYSVLPFEVRTPEVVADLKRRGVEYIVHLPMQPSGNADPGPGALLASMPPSELSRATRAAIAAVPGANGANNHMGSAVASNATAMSAILGVVRDSGLYFIDSRTTSQTLGYSTARQLGIPAAERQVFLDNQREVTAIRAQFRALLESARQRGGALAIAHPYPETLEALRLEIPAAREAGFVFVEARALLDS